jgi:hypothetical protein
VSATSGEGEGGKREEGGGRRREEEGEEGGGRRRKEEGGGGRRRRKEEGQGGEGGRRREDRGGRREYLSKNWAYRKSEKESYLGSAKIARREYSSAFLTFGSFLSNFAFGMCL